MTARVSASEFVQADPETAFAAMIDLRSQDRWILATKLYALDSGVDVPAVGSRMAALTGIGGMGVLDTMEVTVYDPPHLWVTLHNGGTIKGKGIFEVNPSKSGSLLTWTEELDLPLGALGRVGWLAVKPVVRWALHRSLVRLARGITDGSLPPAAPTN